MDLLLCDMRSDIYINMTNGNWANCKAWSEQRVKTDLTIAFWEPNIDGIRFGIPCRVCVFFSIPSSISHFSHFHCIAIIHSAP